MIRQLRSLLSNPVFFMTLAPILGQAGYFLLLPVVTRYYGPDSFGVLGGVIGAISLFSIIFSLKYELAIPLIKNERDALLFKSFLTIVVFIVGFSAILLFLPIFVNYLPVELVIYSVMGGSLFALYQVHFQYAVRSQCYFRIAISKFLQSILQVLIPIFTFLLLPGLEYGVILGYVLALLLSLVIVVKFDFVFNEFKKSAQMLSRYIDFPKYSAVAALIDSFTNYLPIFFIGSIFGVSEAGIYTLVSRVGTGPIGVLTNSIGAVFLSDSAKRYREGNSIYVLFVSCFNSLLIYGVGLMFFFIMLSNFVGLIFGQEWLVASDAFLVLGGMYVLQFLASTLTKVLIVIEKQRIQLMFTILKVLILFSSFYYALSSSFTEFLIVFSLLLSTWYCLYTYISFRLVKGVKC